MHPERNESIHEQLPRLGVVANMLQISLMPLAYKMHHPEVDVDMSNRELRNQVAVEWTNSYAQPFREYIEDNPRETIDLSDREALLEFLERFSPDATMH